MAYMGFLNLFKWRCGETGVGTGFLCSWILVFSLFLGGCSRPASFTVLDDETKEPIEGAVSLVEWTVTGGLPGLTNTKTAKTIEEVSNAGGIVHIPIVFGIFALLNKPHLKVYKPGYVGWDSRLIYLGCRENDKKRAILKRREYFSWKSQIIYLKKWKEEYTHTSHLDVVSANPDDLDLKTSRYLQQVHEHEALPSNYEKF